ncbi:hypothetical protein ASPCAL12485 [Aspergillus calidoustus]|uniref:NAD(P)-binding domain-containing protein n=1 Tax=Aspergillus calidoustus TaxID=454130 RepID=A0A0U5H5U3_ASPCI|nr:hypothetical protein ASPCAL12485 [Aspergillus calidoustus]
MAPSILIASATGNTTETLSQLLQAPDSPFHTHRILALTRSPTSPVAQHLASLPSVSVIEQS